MPALAGGVEEEGALHAGPELHRAHALTAGAHRRGASRSSAPRAAPRYPAASPSVARVERGPEPSPPAGALASTTRFPARQSATPTNALPVHR